jgi:cytochrome c biogenesis protein CcmG/thiol:disulfide interchange protein DsbE
VAARSSRRLVTGVLLAVAVVLPVGAVLLNRDRPWAEYAARTAPPATAAAVHAYPPGKAAPALRLRTLDGGRVDLAGLRGRPVVVNFWATWCEPCVREFPLLAKAAADHRPDRLAVVGVLAEDRPAAADEFVRRNGGTWPVGVDADRRTAAAWGVTVGLPHTFFVRPDGTLASHQLGELTQATLDRQLAAVLG